MSSTFAQTYSQLIQLSLDAPPDTFNSTEDYNKLDTLGPSLPKLSFPFPIAQHGKQSATTDITLKSIKPPFRFSNKLVQVSLDQTIYKIKFQLVGDVASLKDAGVTPANLKFMIKSKVLSDSTVLSTVAEAGQELAITVMVSPPTASEAVSEPNAAAETNAAKTQGMSVPIISDGTWTKIHAILGAELGDLEAGEVLKKFKLAI